MFAFASLGHALASGLEDVGKGAEWFVAAATKAEAVEQPIEDVTAQIAAFVPQAGIALGLEKLGFASLGVLIAVMESGDATIKQNLLNAGADESFLQQLEAVRAAFPTVIATAKAQFQAQSPAMTTAAKQASLLTVHAKLLPAPKPAQPQKEN